MWVMLLSSQVGKIVFVGWTHMKASTKLARVGKFGVGECQLENITDMIQW